MKKSIKILLGIVIFFIAAVTVVLVITVSGFVNGEKTNIENNWSLSLPKNLHLIYACHSKDMWFGEGIRYDVYNTEDATFSLVEEIDTEYFLSVNDQKKILSWLNSIGVEDIQIPVFSNISDATFMNKSDGSEIYILYEEENNKVYFIQNIK